MNWEEIFRAIFQAVFGGNEQIEEDQRIFSGEMEFLNRPLSDILVSQSTQINSNGKSL